MALAALHYGKHVLVEIPLALTLEDCEAIDATAARLGPVSYTHLDVYKRQWLQSLPRWVNTFLLTSMSVRSAPLTPIGPGLSLIHI